MSRCPSCGTSYPDDARFCTRDGSKLLTAPMTNAGVDAPAKAPATPVVMPAMTPGLAPPPRVEPQARLPFSVPTPARGTQAGRADPPPPVTHT